jgi:aspartate carbamoyltransferase catalytic subunit
MRMRTMHSLGYALSQFDCPITFVSPPDMSLTDEFKAELNAVQRGFQGSRARGTGDCDADVILVEPVVQPDYTKAREEARRTGLTPANYKITRELLATKAKSDAILLHSLPRMDEIPPMSTSPAGHATGRKPSTALSCAWPCWRSCWARWNNQLCKLIFTDVI